MQKFGLENAKKEKKDENEKENAPQKQTAEKKEGAGTMAEERETGYVSINMYYKYVIFGGTGLFLGYFIPLLLSGANQVVINWWLTQWTTNVYQQPIGFCTSARYNYRSTVFFLFLLKFHFFSPTIIILKQTFLPKV